MSQVPVYVLLHQIIQVYQKHIRANSMNTKYADYQREI